MRNARFIGPAVSAALLALTAAGCVPATSKYYTLASTITGTGTPPPQHYTVLVGPVSVPNEVDRPQIVVRVAPNRVEIDDLHCWAGPLADGIAGTVVGDLGVLLGSHDVVTGPAPSLQPTHRVAIDVRSFESMPGRSVALDALWTVTPTSRGAALRSGRVKVEEPVATGDYDALAAAHSRAIAGLSREIAAAILASSAPAPKKR